MKLLLLLTLTVSFNAFAGIKIGVVNIQKVIVSIKEGKRVMGTLKKSFEVKQKELKKEEESIKKLKTDYDKKNMLLSDKVKRTKQNEMKMKIAELQQKTMKYQKTIQKQEAELKKPILEKLRPIIDSVSKSEDVDLTFESSSAPIVYAKSQNDITDKVIKAYDKKHK